MKTTPWIIENEYCAMRCIEGTDGKKIENRVAFIEKTPRIRSGPWTNAGGEPRPVRAVGSGVWLGASGAGYASKDSEPTA